MKSKDRALMLLLCTTFPTRYSNQAKLPKLMGGAWE